MEPSTEEKQRKRKQDPDNSSAPNKINKQNTPISSNASSTRQTRKAAGFFEADESFVLSDGEGGTFKVVKLSLEARFSPEILEEIARSQLKKKKRCRDT
jgi:hypothetical protein